MLPCISLKPQWAKAIFERGKDVENRSWPTHIRGPIAIHAGKPVGRVIGTVELVDCVRSSKSRWAEKGCFHWMLCNPVLLDRPVVCRGWPKIFYVRLRTPRARPHPRA